MTNFDERQFWNDRYHAGHGQTHTADPFLAWAYETFVHNAIPMPGHALDLASGLGRHTIWLAERGWTVTDPDAALREYRRAIAADPAHLDAYVNLGLLLHESGRHEEARHVYEKARSRCAADPVLLFNLGVLLEDMNRISEAMEAYRAALVVDAAFADAHYNLALLCSKAGREKEAIRHMSDYRRLARR